MLCWDNFFLSAQSFLRQSFYWVLDYVTKTEICMVGFSPCCPPEYSRLVACALMKQSEKLKSWLLYRQCLLTLTSPACASFQLSGLSYSCFFVLGVDFELHLSKWANMSTDFKSGRLRSFVTSVFSGAFSEMWIWLLTYSSCFRIFVWFSAPVYTVYRFQYKVHKIM